MQSDILTVASMGCHPLAVLCAVAVRDTRGMEELVALDPDIVAAQARAVLEDIPVCAFRLGSAGSVENIAAIAEILSDYPDIPLVFEPVLPESGSEDEAAEEMGAALCELILPQTTLAIAGPRELAWLAESQIDEDEDEPGRDDAAQTEGRAADVDGEDDDDELDDGEDGGLAERHVRAVLARGVEHVLTTGVLSGRRMLNVLWGEAGPIRRDAWDHLPGHYLGARATLSAAAAATLAHGMAVPEAVREAQEFTWQALNAAYRPGMGLALPDRLFWARGSDEGDEHDV